MLKYFFYYYRIKSNQFENVTEEILELFEREQKETYYIPYLPKSSLNKGVGPRRKLWSRFVNVRAALRLASSSQKKEESKEESPLRNTELIQYLQIATKPHANIVTALIWTYFLFLKYSLSYV